MNVRFDGATAPPNIISSPVSSTAPLGNVIISSFVGTLLEWYDFYIYGTAAGIVFGDLFFPELAATSGMLAAFTVYGIGFLLKPVGGVILSRHGDAIGRKKVLVASLVMMGLAKGAIGGTSNLSSDRNLGTSSVCPSQVGSEHRSRRGIRRCTNYNFGILGQ